MQWIHKLSVWTFEDTQNFSSEAPDVEWRQSPGQRPRAVRPTRAGRKTLVTRGAGLTDAVWRAVLHLVVTCNQKKKLFLQFTCVLASVLILYYFCKVYCFAAFQRNKVYNNFLYNHLPLNIFLVLWPFRWGKG